MIAAFLVLCWQLVAWAWQGLRWAWSLLRPRDELVVRVVTDPDEQAARRAAWDELNEIVP